MPHSPDELRALAEGYLGELAFTPELGGLEEALRYPLESGGKLYRPVIALAVGEAAGAVAEQVLPAAAAVELVHTFSLVHDDLPALDDDDERRGRPSAHIAFGEATALLAGDALLAEAFRLALSYATPMVGRELAQATLGMIGGQYLDVTGDTADLAALHRLKTGALFSASVGVALWVAEVPEPGSPRGARSAPSSGSSSRSSTTCSTGTATQRCTAWRRRAASRRSRRARPGPARRDPGGHECPRGDRLLARRAHGVVRPPAAVLAAFGVSAEPERLPGGMETSWLCGDLVVKPLDLSVEEVRWQGSLFDAAYERRLSRPAAARRRRRLVCLGVPPR